MPDAPLILVVEDDYYVRAFLNSFLEQQGYRVTTADEHSAAAEILRAAHPRIAYQQHSTARR